MLSKNPVPNVDKIFWDSLKSKLFGVLEANDVLDEMTWLGQETSLT